MASFQLSGIDPDRYTHLFACTDSELAASGVVRRVADARPGFPCRVSLEDADVGAQLLLLAYEHHPVASPYRASGPVFVRQGARTRPLEIGEVPEYVASRVISVRAYDAAHMMVAAEVREGGAVAAELDRQFSSNAVAYIHLHNAKQGCFSCYAHRA